MQVHEPATVGTLADLRAADDTSLTEMDATLRTACVAAAKQATMIFVPCKDGISHNEIEDARADHLEAGCNVLLQAMLNAAQTAGSTQA